MMLLQEMLYTLTISLIHVHLCCSHSLVFPFHLLNTLGTMSTVIVGAGIIGISIAYRIAELNPNADITIVSKHFPDSGLLDPEYTSSKAGAHFRPFPSKSAVEYRDSKFTRGTYEKYKKWAVEHPESSIKMIKGIDYLEFGNALYENVAEGYSEVVEDFHVIPKDQLPTGVRFGAEYTTFSVNPHEVMKFMLNSLIIRQKVKVVQREVKSLREVSLLYPGLPIVNCTGNGLLYDGNHDPSCFQIRGQTLLVRAPLEALDYYENHTVTYQLSNGEWCFVIPRPLNGGIIVGGTKDMGGTSLTALDSETQSLISNARVRFPDLFSDGELDILRVNVGFRPARKGGVRLEREVIEGTVIVHCYGFGGSGVEMSYGAAEKAVDLLHSIKVKL